MRPAPERHPSRAVALLAVLTASLPADDARAEQLVVGFERSGPIAAGPVATGPLDALADVGEVTALLPTADGAILAACPPAPGGRPQSTLLRLDPEDGAVLAQWTAPGTVVALARGDGGVWSATSDGVLTQWDAAGAAVSSHETHRETAALVSDGKILYQATPSGQVYSAPAGPQPTWSLATTVYTSIESLALRGTWLLVGAPGHVFIHERDTGGFIYGYNVPNDAASLALSGNDVVVGGSDGSIAVVDPNTGTVAEHAPVSVDGAEGALPISAVAVLDPAPFAHLTPPESFASISNGVPVSFDLEVSPELGALPYLLLGSASGDAPGVDLGDAHLPLNPDAYLLATLHGAPTLTGAVGLFDTSNPLGLPTAKASFDLPDGLSPAVAGLTVHHAFLVVDPQAPAAAAASNAAKTFVVP